MKKIILTITAAAAALALSACSKPTDDSTRGETSANTSVVTPVIVEPNYEISVNILTGEYGSAGGSVAETIENAVGSVYGVKAISGNSLVMGSAVAIACVKAEDGAYPQKGDGDSSANGSEETSGTEVENSGADSALKFYCKEHGIKTSFWCRP